MKFNDVIYLYIGKASEIRNNLRFRDKIFITLNDKLQGFFLDLNGVYPFSILPYSRVGLVRQSPLHCTSPSWNETSFSTSLLRFSRWRRGFPPRPLRSQMNRYKFHVLSTSPNFGYTHYGRVSNYIICI